jgi:hypothetical protein
MGVDLLTGFIAANVHTSKQGGDTVEGNLQTRCERCNLGKSNAM